MSALDIPRASRVRISRSRAVSASSRARVEASKSGRARKCSTRRVVIAGSSKDSPLATVRTASVSRSAEADFSRKPEAPARSAR